MNTAADLSLYLTGLQAAFEAAVQVRPPLTRVVHTPVPIRLRLVGEIGAALVPALAHLPEAPAVETPITFCAWDAASTGVRPPRPPFAAADYHRYGQRAICDDGQRVVMHDPVAQLLFAYDRPVRAGYFWAEQAELSISERAAPLQALFHWALRAHGWRIIHAAALGVEQGGVLLIGNTGAGKSTTALAALRHPRLRYLSDDKCLLSLDPTPQAFGVFNSAKLKADMLERLPHFKSLVAGQDAAYKTGKSLVYLHPAFREHMILRFPVQAVLIARITGRAEAALTPAEPAEALRVLGPSTVIWLPGAETDSLAGSAQLVRQLPCYTLQLASDPADNLDLIAHALERHL